MAPKHKRGNAVNCEPPGPRLTSRVLRSESRPLRCRRGLLGLGRLLRGRSSGGCRRNLVSSASKRAAFSLPRQNSAAFAMCACQWNARGGCTHRAGDRGDAIDELRTEDHIGIVEHALFVRDDKELRLLEMRLDHRPNVLPRGAPRTPMRDTTSLAHESGAWVCKKADGGKCPYLRVLQIKGRVDLVKDVDGRGLETEQCEDQRQSDQRALAATERLQALLPHLPHGHLDDEPLLGAATFRRLEHRLGGGQQRVEDRTEILVHLPRVSGRINHASTSCGTVRTPEPRSLAQVLRKASIFFCSSSLMTAMIFCLSFSTMSFFSIKALYSCRGTDSTGSGAAHAARIRGG
eukprot:2463955-Prymnesium_polylepis.2